jgi:predicted alpha/beta hydrolase
VEELTIGDEAGRRLVLTVTGTVDDPRSIVLLLPAMGVAARYYEPFAATLSARGHVVAALDFPGQGKSLPRATRATRCGYADLVDVDLPAAVARLTAAYPSTPLVLLGHSMGGHLALRHAARAGSTVDAVVLVATGSVWYRCFGGTRTVRNLVFSQLMVATAAVVGHWPGDRAGFAGRQPAGIVRDWARQVRTGDLTGDGTPFDYRGPLLLVDVPGDVLAPQRAVEHLLAALPGARVERWSFRAPAPQQRVDHFRWVKHGDLLAERIDGWLTDRTPR